MCQAKSFLEVRREAQGSVKLFNWATYIWTSQYLFCKGNYHICFERIHYILIPASSWCNMEVMDLTHHMMILLIPNISSVPSSLSPIGHYVHQLGEPIMSSFQPWSSVPENLLVSLKSKLQCRYGITHLSEWSVFPRSSWFFNQWTFMIKPNKGSLYLFKISVMYWWQIFFLLHSFERSIMCHTHTCNRRQFLWAMHWALMFFFQ